jgi:hypothetical protein
VPSKALNALLRFVVDQFRPRQRAGSGRDGNASRTRNIMQSRAKRSGRHCAAACRTAKNFAIIKGRFLRVGLALDRKSAFMKAFA